jgi:hypothetical protein
MLNSSLRLVWEFGISGRLRTDANTGHAALSNGFKRPLPNVVWLEVRAGGMMSARPFFPGGGYAQNAFAAGLRKHCGGKTMANRVRKGGGCQRNVDSDVREVNMKNGKPWLMVTMALAGGLIGGAAASMLGASNAFALHHAHRARTVEAEKFVLLGPNGDQRGMIQVSDKGTAALYLNDESGKERAELKVAADGRASLGFYDDSGLKRVVVGEGSAAGSPAGIGVFSADGNQVAGLSSSPNGEVNLTLYDGKTGLARAGLGLAADGTPALALFDQNGKDRAELHLNKEGKPGLALADESGKSISGLPMQSAQ